MFKLSKMYSYISNNITAKHIIFLITFQLLPLDKASIMPFQTYALITCLLLHHIWPNQVKVILTTRGKLLIFSNTLLSLIYVSACLHFFVPSENIYQVDRVLQVSLLELLYIIFWAVADEILFYTGHKLLHTKYLYSKIHYIHHKYKLTNYLTTFYSHPLDHMFIILAATVTPVITLNFYKISAPIIALYFHLAVVTFVASHQVLKSKINQDEVQDTSHLLHHKLIKVNYGNFHLLDKLGGSHKKIA